MFFFTLRVKINPNKTFRWFNMKSLANLRRKKNVLYAAGLILFGAVLGILYFGFMAPVLASAFTAAQLAAANTYGVTLVGMYTAIVSFSRAKLLTAAVSGVAFLSTLLGIYKISQFGFKHFFGRYIVPLLDKKLFEAVKNEASPSVINKLIRIGANANTKDLEGQTVLMHAVEKGNVDIITTLIRHLSPADLNAKNNAGDTALILAVKRKLSSIMTILLSSSSDIQLKQQDDDGYTALMLAVQEGDDAIVATLIPYLCSAALNKENNDGNTALNLAVLNNNLSILKLLLSMPGIQINKQGNRGLTALMIAASHGYTDIVIELIPYLSPKELHTKNNSDNTALILAAYKGHTSVVTALLSSPGIQVDQQGQTGLTALIVAASQGHESIVKSLLANRSNINVVSNDGKTAIAVALKNAHLDIVELLKARGAVLHPSDKKEWDEAEAFFKANPYKVKFKKANTKAREKGGSEWGRSFVKINGNIYGLNNTKRLTFSMDSKKTKRIIHGSENDVGFGGFGRIKFALNQKNEFFAIKVSGQNSEFDKDKKLLLQKKGHVLGQEKGEPGIIKIGHTNTFEGSKIYTAMPYYGGGELLEHNNRTNPEVLGLYILMEIEKLHREGYIHRDIKPDNFMLTKVNGHFTALPVDFDLMIKIPEGQESIQTNPSEVYYTPGFDAPEIHSNREYSFATDVYALGKTLQRLGCKEDIYEKMVKYDPKTRRSISNAMAKIVKQLQDQPKTSDIDRALNAYKAFNENHGQKKDQKMQLSIVPSVDLSRCKEIVFSNGIKNQLAAIKEEDDEDEIPTSSHVIREKKLRCSGSNLI